MGMKYSQLVLTRSGSVFRAEIVVGSMALLGKESNEDLTLMRELGIQLCNRDNLLQGPTGPTRNDDAKMDLGLVKDVTKISSMINTFLFRDPSELGFEKNERALIGKVRHQVPCEGIRHRVRWSLLC